MKMKNNLSTFLIRKQKDRKTKFKVERETWNRGKAKAHYTSLRNKLNERFFLKLKRYKNTLTLPDKLHKRKSGSQVHENLHKETKLNLVDQTR